MLKYGKINLGFHRKRADRVMKKNSITQRFVLSFILLVFSFALSVITTISWIKILLQDNETFEVGFLDVNIDVYFQDGVVITPGAEVEVATGVTKPGCYLVNLVDNSSVYFFEDFRVQVQIFSNVNTYFRVKIYEQLTYTYTSYEGVVTELTVMNPEYMPFNYSTTNWYDNRSIDNYIYYTLPVQRTSETVPLVLDLVASAPVGGFATYSPGYSLQIAFSIEAVQADGGPQNVWSLATPPWGSTW